MLKGVILKQCGPLGEVEGRPEVFLKILRSSTNRKSTYGRGSLILLVAQDYFFAFFNLPTAYFFLLQVIGYDANYTVRIDEDSIGRYICRASVKGFPEISATAELFMKGPPRILNTGKYIQRQH